MSANDEAKKSGGNLRKNYSSEQNRRESHKKLEVEMQ